jgi:hypothetical protein
MSHQSAVHADELLAKVGRAALSAATDRARSVPQGKRITPST